jgi:thermitase
MAWEATRARRNPVLTLGGFLLIGLGVGTRLLSGGQIVATAAGVLLDFGFGFLLAGAVLLARRASATAFVVLGVTALVAGSLTRLFVASDTTRSAEAREVQLLVELGADDHIDELAPLLSKFGGRYERAFPTVSLEMDEDLAQVFLVTVPARDRDLIDRLRQLLIADEENVDFVEVNRFVKLAPPPQVERRERTTRGRRFANDPLAESQWALDAAAIDKAHQRLASVQPARKAIVAILDTGVDARHEDISGAFLRSPAADDGHGHGTHCAGIAGAYTNNSLGMASLNWEGRFIEIASYRALSSSGIGTIESIAQAIIDATADGADVISMSLGDYAPQPPRAIREAVDFAQKRDVIVVAAAGNSNQDAAHHMPANIDGVIAVSAVEPGMKKASFSNTNTTLGRPIAAPGVDILSLVPDGGYETKSGTSMATPLVAGLIGTMRAIDPSLSAEDAYQILHSTGQDVEDSRLVGRVIDAENAIAVVSDGRPPI